MAEQVFPHPQFGPRPGDVGEAGAFHPLTPRCGETDRKAMGFVRAAAQQLQAQLPGSLSNGVLAGRNTLALLGQGETTTPLGNPSSRRPSIHLPRAGPCPTIRSSTTVGQSPRPTSVWSRAVFAWRRSSGQVRPFGLHSGDQPPNGDA